MTKNSYLIKKLEQSHKVNEIEILKTNFKNELNYDDIKIINKDSQITTIFNSSFCNGSSMILLEMAICLRDYPLTICDIQFTGHKILQQILSSQTKSIEYTINLFLNK